MSYNSQMAVCHGKLRLSELEDCVGSYFKTFEALMTVADNEYCDQCIISKNDVHEVLYTATPLYMLGTVCENSEIS